ncbi:ribonuclease H-like protein [Pleomassaria siparia CBS 279.74]|uniref:Ribonuclease H-like protein n=1 Tax=Pleomassaria siparia CBS 279.74 TaxID=1314801 RepID=A0A6G1JVI7_9PLEO|nr:ribonuclease H-like protein [Pleomassaria siparia CBS 279.74]
MGFSTDEIGEEIHRLFDPADDPSRWRIPLSDLVVYNEEKGVSQLRIQTRKVPQPRLDERSMVVYIDGACRDNGRSNARASYGVYFGTGSPHNANGIVPNSVPQTSTRAEIEALAKAIDIIFSICNQDYRLSDIKIATDSSFLVKAMSEWVEGWIEAKGMGLNGRKVAHYERLKELHEKLDYMEYSDEGGIYVQLWHIPRSMNVEADALANAALD